MTPVHTYAPLLLPSLKLDHACVTQGHNSCALRELSTNLGLGQAWITHACGLEAGLKENQGRDGTSADVGKCAQAINGKMVKTGTCQCWRDSSKVGYHCVMTPRPEDEWTKLGPKLVLYKPKAAEGKC